MFIWGAFISLYQRIEHIYISQYVFIQDIIYTLGKKVVKPPLKTIKAMCIELFNLQANVSATIRLFGGDSSHTPFFDWQRFQDNTLYPLAIIHMEHINVLDFDDKSERNLCFSFGNSGIIFNSASAQLFPPREKW